MASIVTGLIEQVKIDTGANQSIASTAYGVCNTLSDYAAKTVEMTGFELITGVTVHIKFTYSNAAENPPTLNINNTGAKPIVLYNTTSAGTDPTTTGWLAGAVLSLTYDGTSWVRDSGNNVDTHYVNGTGLNLNSQTNAFSVIYGNTAGTAVQGNDARLSDARAPLSHTHGAIQNNGTLQQHDVAIGAGDKLVVTDNSDGNIVVRSSLAFDGSTTTKFLSQKGTWEEAEAYILPLAADGLRGGIQVGFTTNATARLYAVLLDNEKAYVNIPWTDTNNAVLQTIILSSDNKEYNVLLKNTADDRDEVDQVRFISNNKNITVNSTTGILTVPGGINGKASAAALADVASAVEWTNITNRPTTIAGYNISDASINDGVITLGNTTITPVTSVNGHTGSSVTVTAGDLGLSSALRFIGKTTSTMTDGFTGVPAGISGYSVPIVGDVVLDSSDNAEYVCISSSGATYTWELLGAESSFKKVQTAVTDGNASTAATTTFVQAVTQDVQGKITVTKASLNTTGTWNGKAVKDGDGNTITTTYVKKVTSTNNAIAKFNGTDGTIQNSTVLINGNNIETEGNIYFKGGTQASPTNAEISLTSSNLNLHVGWNYENIKGAGIDFHSILMDDNPGGFYLTARKTGNNNSSITTQLIGTPGTSNDDGILTWAGRRVVTSTNSTQIGSSTQPVYVSDAGVVTACTSYANATVGTALVCSGNAATSSAWQYDRKVYIALNTDHSSSSPAVLNASTQNAAALAIGVDGTLPVKHGGTNKGSWTQYSIPYLSNTTVFSEIAPNTTATKKFLSMTGTGSVGATPSWAELATTDIPVLNILDKTSGTLSVERGGTGLDTMTYLNSVLIANGTTANGTLQTVRTANGAFYATGTDGAPQFGTLQPGQGGTGVTSIADLRTALNIGKIYYGTCDTAAATSDKIVTCSNFVLETGAVIFVQFTNTNTASPTNLSMRINSSNSADNKPIRYYHNDEATPSYLPAAGYIKQNQTYRFHYDGTNYIMDVAYDEDTLMPGVRVYRYATESLGVYDHDLPFLVSATQTGNIGNGANSGTYTENVFGVINNNATYMPTVNVHTGLVKLPSLQVAGKSKFNGIKGSNNVDYGYILPASPEEGQIFFQFSNTAYELPTGGTTGQVLVKKSNSDRDVQWAMAGGAILDNNVKYYVAGSELSTTNTDPLVFNTNIYVQNNVLFGAAWNDYAEKRQCDSSIPGTCVIENDDGKLTPSSERLTSGACIISDTYGMCIGETEKAKVPVAITGRVLAYTYQQRENYHAGMAVCSAPNGTVDIMTREEIRDYPDAIVGIVSEIPSYEKWGPSKINVNNRIWIKVK